MSPTEPARPGGPAPWLVVVDLQHGFREGPWGSPGFDAAAARVAGLVADFGERVCFTRFVPASEPTGAWVDYDAAWPFARQAPTSTWEIVDGVGRRDAHPVVDATTFGKWGPALREATGGGHDLVVCGVSTDCCVLSTVLAAADGGAHARVVADACAGVDDASHRRALDAMAMYAPLVTIL